MKDFKSGREKWELYLAGDDTGAMVSPLCDDWSLDVPYRWPFDEPEYFPEGHQRHSLCQQMAMAEVCGYDPLFLSGIDFICKDLDAVTKTGMEPIEGGKRETVTITTPYGDLVKIVDHKRTSEIVRDFIETEEDMKRAVWYTQQCLDYDENIAISQGEEARRAVGDKGMLGTWSGAPAFNMEDQTKMYLHAFDWPDLFEELHVVTCDLKQKRHMTFKKAGFDYLFYCVGGTEYSSPDFLLKWVTKQAKTELKQWQDEGGFIVWHSCGLIKKLIETGFYDDFMPEILETLSEAPFGNLPSLKWARERIHRDIITKGNLSLDIISTGTPEDVRNDVRRIRDETCGYRHIVGLSDDIMKNTPVANVLAFVDEARKE